MTRSPVHTRILSPKERRQRNRAEMIEAILDTARGLMREEGVAALNLREVARRLGMQGPSLYEYFPSKTALYDALFCLGARLFLERQDALFQRHASFWDSVQAAMEDYLAFALEYPELQQLVFERPVPGFVPSEAGLVESRKLVAVADRLIARGVAQGILRPEMPLAQLRDLMIATVHGMAAQHLANEPDLPMGSGRFGNLIPLAMELFRTAWDPEHRQAPLGPSENP